MSVVLKTVTLFSLHLVVFAKVLPNNSFLSQTQGLAVPGLGNPHPATVNGNSGAKDSVIAMKDQKCKLGTGCFTYHGSEPECSLDVL